ncbi:uncharacterized protein [Haliotis cracherodii]|uniref:uncharacterized protein n=1 Tax=Haliotis cracherodii TaxID=6455 RepID=UPI0039E84BA5
MDCRLCLLLLFVCAVVYTQGSQGITRQHQLLMTQLQKMDEKLDTLVDTVKDFKSDLKQNGKGNTQNQTEKSDKEVTDEGEYDEEDYDEEDESDEEKPDIPTESNEWGTTNAGAIAIAEEKKKQELQKKKTQEFLKRFLGGSPGNDGGNRGLLFG